MPVSLLIARLLLAAIFVVAGAGKLSDAAGSRDALVGFGIPSRLATLIGILLPVVELIVAAALIPGSSAWFAALAAVWLFLALIAGIAINLARGRSPDCYRS